MRRVLALLFATVLLVPVVAGARAEQRYRYELVALNATVTETQRTFYGSANGDGTARLEVAASNRPRGRLAGRRGKFTIAVRLRGSGDARATLIRASRFGEPPGVFECSSTVDVSPSRTARSTFARGRDAAGRPVVHVAVGLPYVRAPVMSSADDPPACPVGFATLRLRRVASLSVFTRKQLTLTFAGRRRAVSGDTTYTTAWTATVTLRRL